MKTISLDTYKTDKYYPRVTKGVSAILDRKDFIAPLELFKEIGLVEDKDIENWRHGRVPYFEKIVKCNLSAASRVLRILRMHAHDLKLKPSLTVYKRWGKGQKTLLQFSKTNTKAIEEAYSRHFVRLGRKREPEPQTPVAEQEPPMAEGVEECPF